MPFQAYVYDEEEAIRHIASRTNLPEQAVAEFIRLRTRYMELIGAAGFRDDFEIAEEKRLHADLLPAEKLLEDPDLLLAYVCRLSRLPASQVADMMAEETSYMVEIKIMDPDSYPDSRSWADGIAEKTGGPAGSLPN